MQRIVAPDGDWQESITRNFEGRSNTNYVSVGLKAWLFDIRALQDALGTLLSAIVGTGNRVSMEKRLNKGDPVAHEIDASLPGYRNWFTEVRDVRTVLKEGDRFAAIRWDDHGVTTIELAAYTPEAEFQTTFKESLPIHSCLATGLASTRGLMALALDLSGNAPVVRQ